MKIGTPREVAAGERRVAATPDTVRKLCEMGFTVRVEQSAGEAATFSDSAYEAAGAEIVTDPHVLWRESDLIVKVRPPTEHEVDWLSEGSCVVSFMNPTANEPLLDRIAARGASVLAMDQIPRITIAQQMDALSSMANIAGYRAVVEATYEFGGFFTGQITAAGRVPPAHVLVIGAGVAGLQAIASAKSLGAVVSAFDTREEAKEQVQSLGAKFLEVDIKEAGEGGGGYAKVMSKAFIEAEMKLFHDVAPKTDIVITTALIPGRPAPKLWDTEAVEAMKPGSVIVDLAAEAGGNCAQTEPGKVAKHGGVTIIGYTDLTSRLPTTASELYATNIVHLLNYLGKAEGFKLNTEDDVVYGALIVDAGTKRWPPAAKPEPPKPEAKPTPAETKPTPAEPSPTRAQTEPVPAKIRPSVWRKHGAAWLVSALLLAGWIALRVTNNPSTGAGATAAFLQHLTVFVLACFVGWQVIWNVTPALHTPLMSVTNAISGIIVVGGLLHVTAHWSLPPVLLGLAAVLFASINISGGFLVTQRMLKMFRK